MSFEEFLETNIWASNILKSAFTIFVAIFLYLIISNIIIKSIENKLPKVVKNKNSNSYTYIRLTRSVTRYIFIIVTIFVLLKVNGVNIGAMVTGVGVVGAAFVFVLQDALKDVIRGFDIFADSYYKVGDVIKVGEYTGEVIAIGIKTTKLEDIYEKNIISISNRNIEKVEILSHMININIPLPYELPTKKAENTIEYIKDNISKLKHVEKVEYRGIQDFAESSLNYHIKVYCPPLEKVQIRRDSITTIVKCLEEKNIHIPYNQIDIHQK